MLYRPLWLLLYLPLRALFRLRFVHRERLPAEGRVIVCGNHVSYLDPILLALARFRPISYMAKAELFERSRPWAWLMRGVKAFPVHRGRADRQALTEASRRVEAPGAVGIFPEGTRGRAGDLDELGEASGGAALVAMRTGATVVPVGIAGTERALPRGAKRLRFAPVTVVFGEPLEPQDVPDGSRRERMDALTDMLMARIRDAVQEAAEASARRESG